MAEKPRKKVDEKIMKIWVQYKKNSTDQLRNVLMERYLTVVKYNAERIYAKLPDEVELDDLISAGVFGLIDAINAFDLSRGVKFETYCAPRIRGAILDELRSMDWVPRLVRSRAHKLNDATRSLEAEYGRGASDEEIANRMEMSNDEYIKLKRDATAVGLVSLSRKWFETDSQKDVCEIDVLEDKRGEDPLKETQKKDLKDVLTKGLSRAEKLILVLYYYEEMTMKEIGATLDLSESRVSQMHSSILARLKAQISHQKTEIRV
jgi:RNA polymerase sigma factor for flagellar operon FliA